jgi:hypothetical protein
MIVRRIIGLISLLLTVLASRQPTRGDTESRVSGVIGAGRRYERIPAPNHHHVPGVHSNG